MLNEGAGLRPTILLVGSGHWGNPGRDYKSVEFDDMLAPGRQAEIAECVDQLATFAPTKVALEIMGAQSEQLNEDYRQYRTGKFTLTANERHQLGYRVAALSKLERVDAIDWHDLTRSIGWDRAIEFAQERGQEDLISFFSDLSRETESDRSAERNRIRNTRVRDQLLKTNASDAVAKSHWIYMDLSQVGEETNYVGADVILRWYERNMKIFVNISRIATDPNDRVLVVIGGGHLPLLSRFVESSGRFQIEHVENYLS